MLPHVAQAQDNAGCEPYPDVPISITPVLDEPKTDFSADLATLQRLVGDARRSIPEMRGMISLGITHYEPVLEFRLPVGIVTFPDGTSCAHVERADVTIGYRDVTVYIAREIPEGSCGFSEIMAHERKHIAVNREVLDEYTPLIRQRLAEYLKLNGMFREERVDYAVSLLKEKLHAILDEMGQKMVSDIRIRQKAIDSPGEYNRLTASCNGQLAVLGQHPSGGR